MRRLREERGASAVEFAIVASLLFLVLFGTISFGIIYNRYQGLEAASREGGRLGALEGTTRADILQRVRDSATIVQSTAIAAGGPNCEVGLTLDTGCIRVFRRAAPGGTLTELPGTPPANADQPCGSEMPVATEPSVIVRVFYRTRIDIPLWASPQLTIRGEGEFRCESN